MIISYSQIEAFSHYLVAVKRCSPFSVQAYITDVRQFKAWLDLRGDSVSFQNYIDCLGNYSATTVRRKIAAIRAFNRFCGLMSISFLGDGDQVGLPKLRRRLPNAMTIPEMEGVLAIADSYPLRDRLLVHLMYSAGLRVGEVVALRWVDIDCDSDIVMVHGKGGTQRRVPIGSDISRIAMQYRMTMSTVSVTNRVFSLSRRHVQTLIKVMCRAAGLSNSWSAHSLRHSAATHLLAGGGTIRDAQAFLGHQQLSTTQIYTHLVPTQLRDSLKKAHPRY